MKDLIERIRSYRKQIANLKINRNIIQNEIDQKESVLKNLEKLTVNQLEMFELDGEKETLQIHRKPNQA